MEDIRILEIKTALNEIRDVLKDYEISLTAFVNENGMAEFAVIDERTNEVIMT